MRRYALSGRGAGAAAATLGVDAGLLRLERRGEPDTRLWLAASDIMARMAIVVLFTLMATRIGADFVHTGRLTGLLLLVSEALVVVLTVCRRPTAIVDRTTRARLLTTFSLLGPVLAIPAPAVAAILPESVTVPFCACGFLVAIAGKLSLGRSFALMPANRGVVSTGLYRIVRHPIYLGYLITHIGFLAANPTISNWLVLAGADIALLLRAVCEEQTLALDEAYREYQRQVRWRVLPGVF